MRDQIRVSDVSLGMRFEHTPLLHHQSSSLPGCRCSASFDSASLHAHAAAYSMIDVEQLCMIWPVLQKH